MIASQLHINVQLACVIHKCLSCSLAPSSSFDLFINYESQDQDYIQQQLLEQIRKQISCSCIMHVMSCSVTDRCCLAASPAALPVKGKSVAATLLRASRAAATAKALEACSSFVIDTAADDIGAISVFNTMSIEQH